MTKEKIIVQRNKRFTESRYSVGIYIDGEFVVNTIKSNRQEIELSPSKHLLQVKQGNRSGEIEIEVKKGKTLTCAFTSTSLTNLVYALFMGAILGVYMFPREEGPGIFLYLPALLVALYTFTRGRKAYFVFEKTTEDQSWLAEQNN
jgi:hypothetical protein